MKVIGLASDHAGFELNNMLSNGWSKRLGVQRFRNI